MPGRLRRTHRGAGEQPQRLPGAALGHAGRHDRSGGPEAARGHLLPGVVVDPSPPGRAGVGVGDRPGLRRGGLDPTGRGSGRGDGDRRDLQVGGVAAGRRARRQGGRVPGTSLGCRPVPVPVDRRVDPEGPRGRPGRQRLGGDRHRGERRGSPRDRRVRHRHHRVHRGVDGVPALAGGPRPVAGSSWSSPTPTAASRPPSRRCWATRRGSDVEPTSWPTWPPGCRRRTGR